MRSGARVVVLLAVLLLAFQNLSFAQTATTSLRGTVSDAKGLVVAGAEVTLSNAATGFSRSTKTDGQGTYQFLELPPAAYVLTVEAAGFAKMKRENVVLQVSNPPHAEPELAGGRRIRGRRSQRRDPIGQHHRCHLRAMPSIAARLTDLPLKGAIPLAILSLQPGVVYHRA